MPLLCQSLDARVPIRFRGYFLPDASRRNTLLGGLVEWPRHSLIIRACTRLGPGCSSSHSGGMHQKMAET